MNFRQKCVIHLSGERTDGQCLIIGEVAQSHDGSLGMAHSFIDAIANAGADAVKFQTHIAAEESTPGEPWRVKFSPQDETRFEYWHRMEFTKNQWAGLKKHADDREILFMSTPFSERAADMLSEIGMKVWKIASGEVGNLPLLTKIASSGDPVILSSGMSDWDELDRAVNKVRKNGNPMAVLQCTSAYPCPPEKVGLNVLDVLRERYGLPVGLSDHSGKIYAGLAAVSLGAEVLEVHVALSREMFGPDVPASLTTTELRQLVDGSRQIERMLGATVDKDLAADDLQELRRIFTKSLVASMDIAAGTILTAEHMKLKKPGTGLPASSIPDLIGRKVKQLIKADEILLLQNVEI
ncbi:MAG: N-acetylneuraminate synthase family protein [Pyrinomonadaceae bacterium]